MRPPRASSERSVASRAAVRSWKVLLSLVVIQNSSRGMPDAATARPTPSSLPYI